MQCWICHEEMEEEPDHEDFRRDQSEGAAWTIVHDECLLDYFRWRKKQGRPLSQDGWSDEAIKLYESC